VRSRLPEFLLIGEELDRSEAGPDLVAQRA
jgi:hypothetical protein